MNMQAKKGRSKSILHFVRSVSSQNLKNSSGLFVFWWGRWNNDASKERKLGPFWFTLNLTVKFQRWSQTFKL
jgi:hypothetical protein